VKIVEYRRENGARGLLTGNSTTDEKFNSEKMCAVLKSKTRISEAKFEAILKSFVFNLERINDKRSTNIGCKKDINEISSERVKKKNKIFGSEGTVVGCSPTLFF